MDSNVGFPEMRRGSANGWFRSASFGFASTTLGSWIARKCAPLDRRLLLRSNGRFTLLGPIGTPAMLLTTTGAKSGLDRTSALLYARDGDRLVVAGSNFGQQRHPAWSSNLVKNPQAVVTIGGRAVPALARLLEDYEAEAAYRQMMAVAPMYQSYREKTDRPIRVFALTAA